MVTLTLADSALWYRDCLLDTQKGYCKSGRADNEGWNIELPILGANVSVTVNEDDESRCGNNETDSDG